MSARDVTWATWLRLGYRLHPVRYRSKAALLKGWPQLATNDHAQCERWFEHEYPHANVGGVNEYPMLDVDYRHGGREGLARLEADYGPLPTLTIDTGDGKHLHFDVPAGVNLTEAKVKAARG